MRRPGRLPVGVPVVGRCPRRMCRVSPMRSTSAPRLWSRTRWRRRERRLPENHPAGGHRRQRRQQGPRQTTAIATISHGRVHGAVRGRAKPPVYPARLSARERHVPWEVSALRLGATQPPHQWGSVRPVGRARWWGRRRRRRQQGLAGRAHFAVWCGCPRRLPRIAVSSSVVVQRPPIHGPFGWPVAGPQTSPVRIRRRPR